MGKLKSLGISSWVHAGMIPKAEEPICTSSFYIRRSGLALRIEECLLLDIVILLELKKICHDMNMAQNLVIVIFLLPVQKIQSM